MRHLMDITDFSVEELYDLIDRALDIIAHPDAYAEKCRHKKLATLFYEPSTRTRLSFEAAMLELGGTVLGFSQAASSSVSKGENVADTTRIVSNYADIIAMRHPQAGAPQEAARYAGVPVINAGDGSHWHPTQTLADILTIYRKKGRLDAIRIGFCGDLKYGRTVHSLINCLARYKGTGIVLISPEELRLPQDMLDFLREKNIPFAETETLEESLGDLDILYMTRVQKERFEDPEQYERLKDSYILDAEKMQAAPSDMYVLHPLPRVNEINPDVDEDPRAVYFEQALNGKYMRMALILKLLGL